LLELLPLHRLVALVLVARLSLGPLHALPQLLSLLQLLQTRSVETPWFDLGTICYSWRRMQYTNRSNRGWSLGIACSCSRGCRHTRNTCSSVADAIAPSASPPMEKASRMFGSNRRACCKACHPKTFASRRTWRPRWPPKQQATHTTLLEAGVFRRSASRHQTAPGSCRRSSPSARCPHSSRPPRSLKRTPSEGTISTRSSLGLALATREMQRKYSFLEPAWPC
jgi:hypothetical protein